MNAAKILITSLLIGLGVFEASTDAQVKPPVAFQPETIDSQVIIGYGTAIGDVDGDGNDGNDNDNNGDDGGNTTSTSTTTSTTTLDPNLIPIGTQIWTNRNLDVTTYRNGDVIPQVTDPTAWGALTTGAWCYYNNDPTNNAVYGRNREGSGPGSQ